MKKIITEINQIAISYYITFIVLIIIMSNLNNSDIRTATLLDTFLFAYILPISVITILLSNSFKYIYSCNKRKMFFEIGISLLLCLFTVFFLQFDSMLTISRLIMFLGIAVYLTMLIFSFLKKGE